MTPRASRSTTRRRRADVRRLVRALVRQSPVEQLVPLVRGLYSLRSERAVAMARQAARDDRKNFLACLWKFERDRPWANWEYRLQAQTEIDQWLELNRVHGASPAAQQRWFAESYAIYRAALEAADALPDERRLAGERLRWLLGKSVSAGEGSTAGLPSSAGEDGAASAADEQLDNALQVEQVQDDALEQASPSPEAQPARHSPRRDEPAVPLGPAAVARLSQRLLEGDPDWRTQCRSRLAEIDLASIPEAHAATAAGSGPSRPAIVSTRRWRAAPEHSARNTLEIPRARPPPGRSPNRISRDPGRNRPAAARPVARRGTPWDVLRFELQACTPRGSVLMMVRNASAILEIV